jgi:hypothetical protein
MTASPSPLFAVVGPGWFPNPPPWSGERGRAQECRPLFSVRNATRGGHDRDARTAFCLARVQCDCGVHRFGGHSVPERVDRTMMDILTRIVTAVAGN